MGRQARERGAWPGSEQQWSTEGVEARMAAVHFLYTGQQPATSNQLLPAAIIHVL